MLAIEILDKIRERWRPPPDLRQSEWSSRHRYLSKEASAEPGRFDMDRTPFMREIIDSAKDPTVFETWAMKSAQIAWSENLCNLIGYHVDQDPAPVMMIQPTLQMAEAFSKDRISPMIRDTPRLSSKIDDRSRTSGNTILHKKFPGGHLTLCGANSPASLASRPIRVVLADEVDRFPASAGDEGDPISLAKRRQATFWNAVFFAGGTPTTKGASRTERGFLSGDRRRYHVPCPHCGEMHVLKFERLECDPESERFGQFECPGCGEWIDESHKREIIRDREAGGVAEWRASEPFQGIASFHIWAAYSPWMSWRAIAVEWNRVKDDPQLLKAFTNTILGETFEEAGEKPESEELMNRRENYEPGGIPEGVLIITAGIDTQGDRLEGEVVGWGIGEESWSLDYRTFPGDPSEPGVWDDLDAYLLNSTFTRRDGVALTIKGALIDSGGKGSKATGHVSDAVYKFTRGKQYRGIFACKGSSVYGQPIVARISKLKKPPIKLVMIGTDTAKDLIYSRLALTGDGPARCHFPLSYDRRYFEMLTAEEKIEEMKAGSVIVKWRPARDEQGRERQRNEALDCRVYATASLRMQPVNLKALARKRRARKRAPRTEEQSAEPVEKPEETEEKVEEKPKKSRRSARKRGRRRRGGGWSTGAI